MIATQQPKVRAAIEEECVVAVYDSIERAEIGVRILKRAGLGADRVSIVASNLKGHPQIVEELKLGDDSVRDAAIGAGLGGILGLLAGIGLAAIPVAGLVVFLIGPIGGAATGTIVGGLVGSMLGWGVRKDQIQHYEQTIQAGQVLVIINGNPLELVHAERVLRETGAKEVNLHSKTGSDSPEVYRRDNWPPTVAEATRPAVGESQASFHREPHMALIDGRERFERAVRILADEKGRIKERLLIAYSSHLSLVDPKADLPQQLQDDFFTLKNAISDAEMPYGSGQRAAEKIDAMTEEDASAKASEIFSLFERLTRAMPQRAAGSAL